MLPGHPNLTEGALSLLRGQIHALLDAVPLAVIALGADERVAAWNPAAERLFGWSAEDVLGKPLPIVPPERYEEFRALIGAELAGARHDWLEVQRRRKDGSLVDVALWTVPLLAESGAAVGTLGFFADMTERHRVHAALAEQQAQLEGLRAGALEITRELNLTRLLHLLIARAVALVGASTGTVYLWQPASQLLVPGAWHGLGDWQGEIRLRLGEGVAGAAARARETVLLNDYRSSAQAHPLTLQHTDLTASVGEPLIYREELVGAITLGHEGGRRFRPEDLELLRPFAVQAAIAVQNARLYEAARRELAERTRAEETLRRYELLAEQARDIVLFVRRDGRVCEANQAAVQAYGYTRDELLAMSIQDLRSPETHGLTAAQLAQADSEGLLFETTHRRKDGRTFPVEVSSRGTTFGGERVLLSIIRDITARRGAERALRESEARHRELAEQNAALFQGQKHAYEQLQRAQEELVRSEKLRALGQLAAGVAHDLNNTLSVILGHVDALRFHTTEASSRDALVTIERAILDGAATVRRLQDFGRQEAAALGPVDLALAAQEALTLTRPRWQREPERGGSVVQVEMQVDALPLVQGIASEIRVALTNLILNALDAMPGGGRLRLEGRVAPANDTGQAGCVELLVGDSGTGMTEEVRTRAFDPFFTTKGSQGSGLGLSVVYGIMARHGGSVSLASSTGSGTVVTLRFQRAVAPTAPVVRPAERPSSSCSLLVVEDDDDVRSALAALLRGAGHTVVEAASGEEGVSRFAVEPVDLVLTDLGMPGMSGWQVAQAVKRQCPECPVIVLTGWGTLLDGRERDAAVDRVLAKPARRAELLTAIAELTEKGDRRTRREA